MENNNYLELYDLKVGDLVKAPNDESIGDNLSPNNIYQVVEISEGALCTFYIIDDNGEAIACVVGYPDAHLNGLTWTKVQIF